MPQHRLTAPWVLFTILPLVILLITTACRADDRYVNYPGFSTPHKVVLPDEEVHPSLWFRAEDIEAIRSKRNLDSYMKQLWSSIERSTYLWTPLPFVPQANNTSAVRRYYADMSRIAKYNAFYWLITEDDFHKQRAIDALLRAYDGPIYQLDPTKSSSPVDEIYRATWLQNFAEAYDWIQPELTPEQDAAIRAALAKEAQTIYENLTRWAPRPHNHLSKPAWALGTAALTLSSHPMAERWLQEAIDQVNRTTSYFFSADGIYREGAHYYIFSWVNFVPFLYHYKNVSQVDLFPAWQPAFEWALYVRNGKGWLPNIADSWFKPAPLHMVASQYMDVSTPLHPTAPLGSLFQWSYFHTDLGLWSGSYTGASLDDTLDIHEYLTYDPTIPAIQPTGSGNIFLDIGGQTVFRNNWTYNDPSHRYLLFHGVAWSDNHSHFDTLSFIIHAENQLMASDAGYTRDSYGDAIRTQWYETPAAHNVVTLDGRTPFPENPFGPDITPVSRYTLDTAFFAFQEKEAPYARGGWKGTQRRAIAFPGLEYFVVADNLESVDSARWDLYLHGGRGTMSGTGNHRLWKYSRSIYGDAAQFAAWIFPAQAEFTDRTGEITYVKGDYQAFPYVQATQEGQRALFMQVLVPLPADAEVPDVVDRSTEDFLAAEVRAADTTDTFILQDERSGVTVDDVTTDATFAWIRARSGRLQEFMVREATRLAYGGTGLLTSSAPVTLTLAVADDTLVGAIAHEAPDEYTLHVSHPEGRSVTAATLNGKDVPVTMGPAGTAQLTLRGGGDLVVSFAQ